MSLRKALYWSLGGDWMSFVASMAGMLIVARLLTPAEMGIFTFAGATMGVLTGIFGQGMNRYVFISGKMDPRKFGTVILLGIGQGMLISIPLAIAAPFVGAAQHAHKLTEVMLLLALTPPLLVLESIWQTLLSRDLRYPELMTTSVIKTVLATSITIVAAWKGYGPLSQALGMVVSITVNLLILTWLVRDELKWRPSLANSRDVLAFLRESAFLGAIFAANGRLPDLILGSVLRLSDLGQWGRANVAVGVLRGQVIEPMMRVQLPAMARDRDAGLGMGLQIERFNTVFAGMLWPMLALLAVMAKPSVTILLGKQWSEAAMIVPVICLYNLLTLAAAGAGETYLLTNNIRKNTWYEVARFFVLGAVLLAAAPYGLFATACAILIEGFFALAWKFQVLVKWGGASAMTLIKGFQQGAFLSAAMAAPGFAVMSWYGWPPMLPFWLLIAIGLAGCLCWLGVATLIGHPAAGEVRLILDRFLDRFHRTPVAQPN